MTEVIFINSIIIWFSFGCSEIVSHADNFLFSCKNRKIPFTHHALSDFQLSEKYIKWCFITIVCVCSHVCEHVKKRFPKPPSPPALVYLFSLMIVFLILAWLHSSAGVDCTVLSLQMTSIWTVSIWHAFIYVGSRKAIFRWVSHFLSSFVVLTDQTLLWSFNAHTYSP